MAEEMRPMAGSLGDVAKSYDLVIAGGGVTGAGIFHRAATMGLRPLLVEAKDYGWGTSSRSSKMVHGGLRYLKQVRLGLTRASVRERRNLLSLYGGLVTPLGFLMPLYADHGPSRAEMEAGLAIYSLMAGKRQTRRYDRTALLSHFPGLRTRHLKMGLGFMDAQVDDARLVLRLIQDGVNAGGHALNYTRLAWVNRNLKGEVAGVGLSHVETGKQVEVKTPVVVNATGAFAEALHPCSLKGLHIRPIRGSHLIFPREKLPLDRVLSFFHPRDNRAVFLFPWENVTVAGTTEADHTHVAGGFCDPSISPDEARYLMEGVGFILPQARVTMADCRASMAGVRPILSRKQIPASKESREHGVWSDKGLVTVTGGKLTTFRLLAVDALKEAGPWLPQPHAHRKPDLEWALDGERGRVAPCLDLENDTPPGGLDPELRLQGRYGSGAAGWVKTHGPQALEPVGPGQTLWAELLHGAAMEGIRHLDDLLLRRVRLGLFLPNGGMDRMDEIRSRVTPHLDWDADKWEAEIQRYHSLWQTAHAPPEVNGGDENWVGRNPVE